ncbi:cupin domain-containing protein [Novosphingobium sp. M1R2S20]|uniref:Cupin domain-containing protein n=1 Tax=Novosphingobium rhizovicinum TaxID=3228928 RepID=A0ABV3RG95_9SPHN
MSQSENQRPRFEIFRGSDAPSLAECQCMTNEGETPNLAAALERFPEMMGSGGEQVDVPYRRPGMSLARLWVKSGFPLPLHTHDCDCLYYVVAGSIHLGNETLEAGDGFFVGSEVPYGYTAGPEGAEVLEFRATDVFNIRLKDKPVASWEKAADQIRHARERWADEAPPVRRVPEKV